MQLVKRPHVTSSGIGYEVGDELVLEGGSGAPARVVVDSVRAVDATVDAAGTG